MFALGLFLRQYENQIRERFTFGMVKLLILGLVLCFVQWFGLAHVDLPFGAFLEVVALVLLTTGHPEVCDYSPQTLAIFRRMSVLVYFLHWTWNSVMLILFEKIPSLQPWAFLINDERWHPLLVLLVAIIMAWILSVVSFVIQRIFRVSR